MIHYDLIYLVTRVLRAYALEVFSGSGCLQTTRWSPPRTKPKYSTKNLRFPWPQQLLKAECRDTTASKPANRANAKILFAPSWRKCLVTESSGPQVRKTTQALLASLVLEERKPFSQSPQLGELLEEHDYELDIKLHPIFKVYNPEFEQFVTDRVHLVNDINEATIASSSPTTPRGYSISSTSKNSSLFLARRDGVQSRTERVPGTRSPPRRWLLARFRVQDRN